MKRSDYMTLVMENTYSQVAINAVISGTLEGAWEKAIAERLERDHWSGSKLPLQVIEQFDLLPSTPTPETWLKAAYLIRATEPQKENA